MCGKHALYLALCGEKEMYVEEMGILSLAFLYQLLAKRGCAASSHPAFGNGSGSVMGWTGLGSTLGFRIAAHHTDLVVPKGAIEICAFKI